MAQPKPCFFDLPEEIIIKIFSQLPANKLLSTETVSRNWSRCVGETLKRVEILAFGKQPLQRKFSDHRCQHFRKCDLTRTLIVYGNRQPPRKCRKRPAISAWQIGSMLQEPKQQTRVPLLLRCRQVKCVYFDGYPNIEFADVEALKKLLNALPQLECLFYGWCKINNFNYTKWTALCQEVGHKIKHLTVRQPYTGSDTIDNLIAACSNLELIHIKMDYLNELPSLRNRNSIDLSLKYLEHDFDSSELNDESASVICSQAKNLSIWFQHLQVLSRYSQPFARLNWLHVEYEPFFEPIWSIDFPVLQHLVLDFMPPNLFAGIQWNLEHLEMYNLPNLKSLTINSRHNDDVLTAWAGNLTSLEKLVLKSLFSKQLPTDPLLRLERLQDLRVIQMIDGEDDLLKVVRLFEILAQKQLRRCRIELRNQNHYEDCYFLNPLPEDLDQQLTRALDAFLKTLPSAEIHFPLRGLIVKTLAEENNDYPSDSEDI